MLHQPYHYVMVDIESLATSATIAPILEIAAVPFSPTEVFLKDHFYTPISYDDNIRLGRKICKDTLIWWFQQTRKPILNSTVTALEAFTKLARWAAEHTDKNTQWYCQGTSFDPVILGDFFDSLLIPTPWKYHQWNCCRTLQKHFSVKKPKPTTHHPIDDCLNQIASIQPLFTKATTDPGPMLWVASSEEEAKKLYESRLMPLVDVIPAAGTFSDPSGRTFSTRFDNTTITSYPPPDIFASMITSLADRFDGIDRNDLNRTDDSVFEYLLDKGILRIRNGTIFRPQTFTLVRYVPFRHSRGEPAAQVRISYPDGETSLLWMSQADIRNNIEIVTPEEVTGLTTALEAYTKNESFPPTHQA